MHSGAPIAEINAVRKHLLALKGGRLARAARPACRCRCWSLMSENSLDALASGPTMADTTTVADCYAIVERYNLLPRFPETVRTLFERGQLQETPKQGDPASEDSRYVTVLSNATATNAAIESALLGGFAVELDNSCDDWDYQRAADHLLGRLRELRQGVSRACLVSGGEVTVQVGAGPGVGGGDQQFARCCARQNRRRAHHRCSAQAPTALMATVWPQVRWWTAPTVERANQHRFEVTAALADFNAFPLLNAIGDAIVTGPTGNNVRDLRILLAY